MSDPEKILRDLGENTNEIPENSDEIHDLAMEMLAVMDSKGCE